jgi:hypothetical protein
MAGKRKKLIGILPPGLRQKIKIAARINLPHKFYVGDKKIAHDARFLVETHGAR